MSTLPFLALLVLMQDAPEPKDVHGDPLPQGAAVRLGRVDFGHARWIYGMSLSADDKTLATGGPDNSIRIWDPATGRLRRLISTGWIMTLEMTPNGRLIASAAAHQKCIRIHDVASGRELRSIPLNDASFLAFSPDGSLIGASGYPGEVRIWRTDSGEQVHELKGFTGHPTGVAFADGGRRFIAGNQDRELRIWDVATGKELRKITFERPPLVVKPSTDSTIVAVSCLTADDGFLGPGNPEGAEANAIHLVDFESGKTVRKLKGCEHVVYALALSPDGKRCAAADASPKPVIRLWDTVTGEELRQLSGHDKRISQLTFTSHRSRLISTSDDRTIRIWDVESGKDVTPGSKGGAPTLDLAWSPDSKCVATAGQDGKVRLWDSSSGKELATFGDHEGPAPAIAYSPDGSRLVTGGEDRTIRIWKVPTRKLIRTLGPLDGAVYSVAFDSEGDTVFASGRKFLGRWDAQTGAEKYRIPLADRYTRLSISPDGRTVAVSQYQHRVLLFDATDGREILTAVGCAGPGIAFLARHPHELAWLSESQRLVWMESKEPWIAHQRDGRPSKLEISYDREDPIQADAKGTGLRGWSLNLKREFRYSDIAGAWQGLDASRDGRWIAVGMHDGSIRLIETITGKEVRQFRWHYNSPQNVAFSPDGTRLASSCASEPFALIWNILRDSEFNRAQPDQQWTALDGSASLEAISAFSRGGDDAVTYLAGRLRIPRDSADRAGKLISILDSDDLTARESAQRELRDLGMAALPSLRNAIDKGASGEARFRLDILLDELEGPSLKSGDSVRRLRAIHILDMQGSSVALKVLESIAKDSPSVREREEAALALKRPRGK